MTISIGSDHAGFGLKSAIAAHISKSGNKLIDRGAMNDTSVDYPDFARAVAADIANGTADFGVLVCGTGIGISIAANKIHDIRAALCHNAEMTALARRHNDANILCLGQKFTTPEEAFQFLKIFLETPFEGGRHARRVGKLEC